jgi:hypothetical protein
MSDSAQESQKRHFSKIRPHVLSEPRNGQNGTFGATFPVPQSEPLSRVSRGRVRLSPTEPVDLQWSARPLPGGKQAAA